MPVMGSWGTVTYLMEPVLVSAGANNPRWRNFKEIALKQGPHACGFISWLDRGVGVGPSMGWHNLFQKTYQRWDHSQGDYPKQSSL